MACSDWPRPSRRVVQLSLLGLGTRAPFEFRLSGWLGQAGVNVDPNRDAPLVFPELERIDLRRLQCFYGESEATSPRW